MKGCLEFDEKQFFIRIPKIILLQYFFPIHSKVKKYRSKIFHLLSNLDSSTKSLFYALVFIYLSI